MRTRTHPAILVERRMAEVDRSDPDACHEWPGVKARGGYGMVSPRDGGHVMERVPRVVLESKLGRPIRPGYYALHRCDNPPCCNPAHLYEGTQSENLKEAHAKQRAPSGERNHFARLSAVQVAALRADDRPNKVVAAELGVTADHVRRIRNGERWAAAR